MAAAFDSREAKLLGARAPASVHGALGMLSRQSRCRLVYRLKLLRTPSPAPTRVLGNFTNSRKGWPGPEKFSTKSKGQISSKSAGRLKRLMVGGKSAGSPPPHRTRPGRERRPARTCEQFGTGDQQPYQPGRQVLCSLAMSAMPVCHL